MEIKSMDESKKSCLQDLYETLREIQERPEQKTFDLEDI